MEGSTAAALKAALATRDGRKLQEGIQVCLSPWDGLRSMSGSCCGVEESNDGTCRMSRVPVGHQRRPILLSIDPAHLTHRYTHTPSIHTDPALSTTYTHLSHSSIHHRPSPRSSWPKPWPCCGSRPTPPSSARPTGRRSVRFSYVYTFVW